MECSHAELNRDIVIRKTDDDKGLGVFALREIQIGEKILVERPVIKFNHGDELLFRAFSGLMDKTSEAIMQLHSIESSSIADKVSHNSFGTDFESVICITASRFNHSCLPNCERSYLNSHGAMAITAMRLFDPGEELSINYAPYSTNYDERRRSLRRNWGFDCTCPACKSKAISEKLAKMAQLDATILRLGQMRRFDEAYTVGEELISLYHELGCPSFLSLFRTYFDMFQAAVVQKKTLLKAKYCLQKTLEYTLLAYDGSFPEASEILECRRLCEHPEKHLMYLLMEK